MARGQDRQQHEQKKVNAVSIVLQTSVSTADPIRALRMWEMEKIEGWDVFSAIESGTVFLQKRTSMQILVFVQGIINTNGQESDVVTLHHRKLQ